MKGLETLMMSNLIVLAKIIKEQIAPLLLHMFPITNALIILTMTEEYSEIIFRRKSGVCAFSLKNQNCFSGNKLKINFTPFCEAHNRTIFTLQRNESNKQY